MNGSEWAMVFCALIGIIVPFYTVYSKNREQRIKIKDLELQIKDPSLSLEVDLKYFNEIKSEVERLLSDTAADRFLILSATNGQTEMRFATALYEQHSRHEKVTLSLGAASKYIRFEFDSYYRKMLKDCEKELDGLHYTVSGMPQCDLRAIYESEKVKFSSVYFLSRAAIDDSNDRIFYVSIATHGNENFSITERISMKSTVHKVRAIIQLIEHENALESSP